MLDPFTTFLTIYDYQHDIPRLNADMLPSRKRTHEMIGLVQQVVYKKHEAGYGLWLEEFGFQTDAMCGKNFTKASSFKYVARRYWLSALAHGRDLQGIEMNVFSDIMEEKMQFVFSLDSYCSEDVFWSLLGDLQEVNYVPLYPCHCQDWVMMICRCATTLGEARTKPQLSFDSITNFEQLLHRLLGRPEPEAASPVKANAGSATKAGKKVSGKPATAGRSIREMMKMSGNNTFIG